LSSYLAESTFDPNLAFRLTRPVRIGMFRPRDRLTRASGPLRVNVIGGGTWVSEFESFTGLDSRLFGYAGYHTHALLSPFVRGSFVHHLNDRGYVTEAYYPVEGTFYNARAAYRHYGFQRFADGPELGLARHWRATDLDVAEAVIRRSDPTASAPFFKQVVFLENHAPHDCRLETPVETELLDGASRRENCLLNEYVRRLHSSSRAFERLLDYLQQEERRSGRPFVLLIYGDHQPYTFTGTDLTFTDLTFAEFDFTRYRTEIGRNVTFFHLLSSSSAAIACCGATMPPLTLMPSLLSLFVARSADEIYLPVGFLAHDACPDLLLLRNAISAGFEAPIEGARSVAPACPQRGAILAAYQASGVMGGFAERP
jgi:phosphoglycerol transferase MdoB-like AlkP superfamily enzyme